MNWRKEAKCTWWHSCKRKTSDMPVCTLNGWPMRVWVSFKVLRCWPRECCQNDARRLWTWRFPHIGLVNVLCVMMCWKVHSVYMFVARFGCLLDRWKLVNCWCVKDLTWKKRKRMKNCHDTSMRGCSCGARILSWCLFWNLLLYGLFPLVMENMMDYLSGTFPYAFHKKRSGCQAHVVVACIEEEDIWTVMLGSVVVESGWEEGVAGLLSRWHWCVSSAKAQKYLLLIRWVGNLLDCPVWSCKAVPSLWL